MKIAYLSYESPFFPGGGGGEIRQYNLLKELKSLHDFHLFIPTASPAKLKVVEEVATKVFCLKKLSFFQKMTRFLVCYVDHGYPAFVQQMEGMRKEVMPLLKQALLTESYDLLHVEHTNIAHWCTGLTLPFPKVLVAQNVKTLMWQRYAHNATGAEKIRLEEEARRFKRYECACFMKYDRIVAVSATDKLAIEEMTSGKVPVDVVDNGVDISYFSSQDVEEEMHLVFTGSMGHPPNSEGVLYFCREIYPMLKGRHPGLRLSIVGNWPGPEILALTIDPSICVTGFVADVRPYIASATVSIVPLLSGSGTRLKILEAMAMGKAIVSTSIGAEGIEYSAERNIVIANNPDEFFRAVSSLLENRDRRRSLGLSARSLVAQRYSWKSIAANLDDCYRLACHRGD